MDWGGGVVVRTSFRDLLRSSCTIFHRLLKKNKFFKQIFEELHLINESFDHLKYSVHIRFIRNIFAMYSVSSRYNPNTVNPYSVYKKTESE